MKNHNTETLLTDPAQFSAALYEKMKRVNPATAELEPFEFNYALENLLPADGWQSVKLDSMQQVEALVNSKPFYLSIKLNPQKQGKPVLDDQIQHLTQMLFVGMVTGDYPLEWISQNFHFDLRGFYFLHRTQYFTPEVIAHLGGKPFRSFEPKQQQFEKAQSIGYQVFKQANAAVDECFIEIVRQTVAKHGTPLLIAIAGPTAAGKTEITSRLIETFARQGIKSTTLEMDHFLTDRDYREAHGIDSLGAEALHYDLLQQCLRDLLRGKKVFTPCYDFITATSSHDLQGHLKPGQQSREIEPADLIFIEGNFPFLLPEIAPMIGVKVVYLTSDEVRLKRKWRRDMDLRKKYNLIYFLNRYFREQFLMANEVFLPQMTSCDLVVDTTGAAIWMTPEYLGDIKNEKQQSK